MKQLFTTNLARYTPNRERGEVETTFVRIEGLYEPTMQVARLAVNDGIYILHPPIHASDQMSALKQMMAAYENVVDDLHGYTDYDEAKHALHLPVSPEPLVTVGDRMFLRDYAHAR